MKKGLFLTAAMMFFLATTLVSAFEFEKITINNVITAENISIPASYYLTIHNTNSFDEQFKVYSILSIELEPKELFTVEAGKEKTIIATMLPSARVKERCGFGECSIQYYIKGEQSGAVVDSLDIKVVPIEKIISVETPSTIAHDTKILMINITNKENINLEKISLHAESDFCNAIKNISIKPDSSITVNIELEQDKLQAAVAGNYTIKLTFLINNEYSYVVEKQIQLSKFSSIATTESLKRSFLGYTKIITKKNEGNSPELVTIELQPNKFENTFTTYSIFPTYQENQGNNKIVGWQRQLEPGESITVEIKTNYTLPVLLLAAVVVGSTAFYITRRPRVIIKKKAYKVRTSTGVHALKIVLHLKNIGNEISDVKCTDYIPKLTELHERFGTAQPDVIDKNKLQWYFGTLMPNESKAVSYILYSKVTPIGMSFPRSVVSYLDYKGKQHYSFSNSIEAFED